MQSLRKFRYFCNMNKKVIIFSAPSGAGKSTVVGHLLKTFPYLEFSISATSRAPRGTERDGVEYYFFSEERFRSLIAENAFIEYEEVYPGSFYGTLRSEVERIWDKGHIILFDIDVKGGSPIRFSLPGSCTGTTPKDLSLGQERNVEAPPPA